MPAIGIVQRDPENYEDPESFRPERFLDGQAPPYTWIPFGGGTRRCLGAAFATFEMKTVLRTVLSGLELRADRPRAEKAKARHITLVPARGARVVVQRRRALAPPGERQLAAV
jgi:cytochrome P450 family 135